MRTLVASLLMVAICAGPASAQNGGHIGVYSDSPVFEDCVLGEVLYAPNTIYVVHKWVFGGATAARFSVSENWDGAIPIAVDFPGNSASGNIFSDVTVFYPVCTYGPHVIATLVIVPLEPTLPCTRFFEVIPASGVTSGQIEVTDCNSSCWFATGSSLFVNGNDNECPCGVGEPLTLHVRLSATGQCDPVAAEPSTWGSIKALYR